MSENPAISSSKQAQQLKELIARGKEQGYLLAATEIPDSEEFDPATELAACLTQLAAAGARERIEFLIGKERLNSLSEEERGELRRLSLRSSTE